MDFFNDMGIIDKIIFTLDNFKTLNLLEKANFCFNSLGDAMSNIALTICCVLLLSYLRKELINEVAETFISNENLILNGTYKNELLNDSKVSYLALRLRKMLEYYVYL